MALPEDPRPSSGLPTPAVVGVRSRIGLVRIALEIFRWLFLRIPWRFSIPLLLLLGLYFGVALPWLTQGALGLAARLTSLPLWGSFSRPLFAFLLTLVGALLFPFGLFASYAIAALVPSLWPARERRSEGSVTVTPPLQESAATSPRLDRYDSIGIILSGGGAKGAYQAGALAAIHAFLQENGAHTKVRMIAGTSIGSWNSLFWLAGGVAAREGKPGLLEEWWSDLDLRHVVSPAFYWPLTKNSFLSPAPWKASFEDLFVKSPVQAAALGRHLEEPRAPGSIHFYFTRSNVGRARLEFTTNRDDLDQVDPNLRGPRRPRPPVPAGTWIRARTLEDVRRGVFSSMDLPPLFPYTRLGDDYFEDGGVVENLPIRFGTELENCDLLFILPLNASFDWPVNHRSILKRLYRVMEIRQGVLERNAFKGIYLYNELAALRQAVLAASASPTDSAAPPTADRAMRRRHRLVQVFAICPSPEVLIRTTEFWNADAARQAFRVMQEATRRELEAFDFQADPGWVQLSLIAPDGSVRRLEDF